MAEHGEESPKESLMDKIKEKLQGDDSSSDSDSDKFESSIESVKAKVYRLFGRERPVHHVLGGGKLADVFLWRNKKISAGVLVGATAIWVLFELLGYYLLTLVCHALILTLAILFLYSNAITFIHKSPPHIPDLHIPEDAAVNFAKCLSYEINKGIAVLRSIALGRDIKKFLSVISGLWALSIVSSCYNFLTLFYIVFVLLLTVPALYEKYDDKVDAFTEKAMVEIKKQYAVFDAKVLSKILSKIPKGLKDKLH